MSKQQRNAIQYNTIRQKTTNQQNIKPTPTTKQQHNKTKQEQSQLQHDNTTKQITNHHHYKSTH